MEMHKGPTIVSAPNAETVNIHNVLRQPIEYIRVGFFFALGAISCVGAIMLAGKALGLLRTWLGW